MAALAEQTRGLQAGDHRIELPPFNRALRREGPPLASFAQEPFWFVQQMSPIATILNMHGSLPLTGELDLVRCEERSTKSAGGMNRSAPRSR